MKPKTKPTKKRKTKKERLIEKIKDIISTNGSFATADVYATSSPVIHSTKNTCMLAERFGKNGADVVTYVHETETGSDTVEYEDMTIDVLHEVHSLAEEWDAICYKTEKRCAN